MEKSVLFTLLKSDSTAILSSWKHLRQIQFSVDWTALCNFTEKESAAEVFSYELCKTFKYTLFIEH